MAQCTPISVSSSSSLRGHHLMPLNLSLSVNPLTPNGPYRGCTAPPTSKRCSLYIYSTNIGTEYFKHGI